ncbi:hypothetical protein PUR23_08000 [Methylorubrum populi]|uniref:hypothetical protein n=1 Tax=Methylorubrum populi TaxID=223967 RepID=UPI0031F9DF89
MTTSKRLRELADVLGVPVAAFHNSKECYHLHVDPAGTRWILTLDAQGKPIVRRSGGDDGQTSIEECVFLFLRREEETPQRDALIALIERLVTTQLKD